MCATIDPGRLHEQYCLMLSCTLSVFVFFPLAVMVCSLGTRLAWRHCRDTFTFAKNIQSSTEYSRAYDDLLRLRQGGERMPALPDEAP
jgi:hypothetical protein